MAVCCSYRQQEAAGASCQLGWVRTLGALYPQLQCLTLLSSKHSVLLLSAPGLGASCLPFPFSPTDFFQGKHFFLYGEFPGDERRKLIRYVTAFNGSVVGLVMGPGTSWHLGRGYELWEESEHRLRSPARPCQPCRSPGGLLFHPSQGASIAAAWEVQVSGSSRGRGQAVIQVQKQKSPERGQCIQK